MSKYIKTFKSHNQYEGAEFATPNVSYCIELNEVHYTPYTPPAPPAPAINANGYEYVDLGLPSGTLWAKYNVGSTSEFDGGDFYMFGYTTPSDASGEPYSGEVPLPLENDAAHVVMGGDWEMPTHDQLLELGACTVELIYENSNLEDSNSALKIIGPNGNHIIIPASGLYNTGNFISNKGFVPILGKSGTTLMFSEDRKALETVIGESLALNVRGVIAGTNVIEPSPLKTLFDNSKKINTPDGGVLVPFYYPYEVETLGAALSDEAYLYIISMIKPVLDELEYELVVSTIRGAILMFKNGSLSMLLDNRRDHIYILLDSQFNIKPWTIEISRFNA